MTPEQAIEMLRGLIGDRNKHHPNCSYSAIDGTRCDCYASRREPQHKALDVLAKAIRETESKGEE